MCGFGRYADRRSRCAVCNIARGTVVAWATPSVTLRLFYPAPAPVVGLAIVGIAAGKKDGEEWKRRSGKDDRLRRIGCHDRGNRCPVIPGILSE